MTDGEYYYPKKRRSLLFRALTMPIAIIYLIIGFVVGCYAEAILYRLKATMYRFTEEEFIIFDLKAACWFVLWFSIVGVCLLGIKGAINIFINAKKEGKN